MIFDETRDNLTRTENQIREADAREAEFLRNSRHIRPLIVTVDELPPATYPKPFNPPTQSS